VATLLRPEPDQVVRHVDPLVVHLRAQRHRGRVKVDLGAVQRGVHDLTLPGATDSTGHRSTAVASTAASRFAAVGLVYPAVVCNEACPSSSCTSRGDTLRSIMRRANVCRSVCGVIGTPTVSPMPCTVSWIVRGAMR